MPDKDAPTPTLEWYAERQKALAMLNMSWKDYVVYGPRATDQ